MGPRVHLDWFVPALFAVAVMASGARTVTVIGHALAHPTARAWLVV
jgi:hypothetical protein